MNQPASIPSPAQPDWHIADHALRHADTVAEQRACFTVMQELRPHLRDADEFLQRIARQAAQSYRMLAARNEDGQVVALAGYRFEGKPGLRSLPVCR